MEKFRTSIRWHMQHKELQTLFSFSALESHNSHNENRIEANEMTFVSRSWTTVHRKSSIALGMNCGLQSCRMHATFAVSHVKLENFI